MRTEAELQEIAANHLNNSVCNLTKLCAQLEFEDLRHLDNNLQLTSRDMQRVQVWIEQANHKAAAAQTHNQPSGPTPAPSSSSSHPSPPAARPPALSLPIVGSFIPRFRTGRRSEAEMREIASDIHNIRLLDCYHVYPNMELQDSQRLLEELLSPETVKHHIRETQFKVMPMDIAQLQLAPPSWKQVGKKQVGELEAIDVPPSAAEEMEKAAYESSLEAQVCTMQENQTPQNELTSMRVRVTDAQTRRMADNFTEMSCIGTGYCVV